MHAHNEPIPPRHHLSRDGLGRVGEGQQHALSSIELILVKYVCQILAEATQRLRGTINGRPNELLCLRLCRGWSGVGV